MPIKISIAKTPACIDTVFKLRHSVFCYQEKSFQAQTDQRLFDIYDTFSTTHNLIVTTENKIVGSLRLSLDSDMGVPADEFYDFRSFIPTENTKIMGCGMYCVTEEYRGTSMALSMILMASYFAFSHQVTHVIAPINPAIAKLLSRVGFKILGEEIVEPKTGLTILPTLLDMNDLNDFFFKFVQQNELQNFLGAYECVFYKAGEYVVQLGEQGSSAFVIIEGEVDVVLEDDSHPLTSLKSGDVFGELALLTDSTRAASVIATTDLRVMSLSKEVFMKYLVENPTEAVGFMKNMGMRMKSLLQQI